MKPRFALAAVALLLALPLLSCGGDGGDADSSDRTPDATREQTERTPAGEPVRAYAQQLCDPFAAFVDAAGDQIRALEAAEPEGFEDFEEALQGLGELQQPLGDLRDGVDEIDPPDELADYHDAFVEQLAFGVEAIEAIAEGGFFAALALPTPPASPEEPAGLQDAIEQECGEEVAGFARDFGTDLFPEEEPEAEATPARGSIGKTVQARDFELLVHATTDPVVAEDEFFEPEEGNRRVSVEVSITNRSDAPQDYGPYDFKLRDADNFEYDSGFVDLERDLSSGSLLPGDTIRGQIGFEVPLDAELVRLVFQGGLFDPANRIDIDLQ